MLGIHEDDDRGTTDVERQLGGQLVAAQDRGPGHARVVGEDVADPPSDPIVRPQDVAVANHQRAVGQRMSSSRTCPSGPTSWSWSGMSPSACVEQDRHGS